MGFLPRGVAIWRDSRIPLGDIVRGPMLLLWPMTLSINALPCLYAVGRCRVSELAPSSEERNPVPNRGR